MKKLFFITFIICYNFVIFAQNLDGKFFVGSTIGFELLSADANIDETDFNNPKAIQAIKINPFVGYYLTDKISLGLQLGYSYTSNSYINFSIQDSIIDQLKFTSKTKVYSVAPLFRYTMPITDKFGFNFKIAIPYSYSKITYSPAIVLTTIGGINDLPFGENNKSISFGIEICPEFQWFVKDHFAIIGSFCALKYKYEKTTSNDVGNYDGFIIDKTSAKTSDLKLSLSTDIELGVAFYF